MAAIEIGQLPLTTSLVGTTAIPIENGNITQKIEAVTIRNYVTTLDFLNSVGNVTAANLVTAGAVFASEIRSNGQIATAGQLTSTVSTGTAPLSVTSTTQVPNLYASRAAIADATTNGLTTTSTFANIVATDIIVGGNNSSLTANLRTVNADTGTFGNSTIVPQLTVDAKGRILAVSNIAISFPAQTLISNTTEITANTVSGTPGLNLTTTGVTAGTYGGAINVPQITVDTKGRVTSITSVPVNSTLNTLNIGMPIGTIALWSGALATIPDGWQICDGTNGTVNLRDRFVVGAGSLYNPGTTGGSADAVVPSHTHTATSTSTFTGAQLPTHGHGLNDPGHRHFVKEGTFLQNSGAGFATGTDISNPRSVTTTTVTTGISVNDQTAGTPSGTVVTSTTLSTEGVTASNRNLPPYYALYYIQKMTDAVSINNPINYMATVGNIIAGGNIVAASGNASISTTTGALVVVGGAGISGNLHVGGRLISTTMPAATANTHVATTAFVATEIAALTYKANLASPAFTGTPTAPTAASGTANTQIATTAFVSAAVGTVLSGFSNMQVFTSSGTFTVPAGVTKVKVTVVGGGGGGSSFYGYGAAGGGGTAIRIISGLTPGGTVSVTVGNGGAGGNSSGSAGSTGGTSSFGAFCSATGGAGQLGGNGINGLGGIGSGGDLNFAGSAGAGSTGGSSFMGGGGSRGVGASPSAGRAYGGGGGAGDGDSSVAGGAGAAGVVVVEY
jgi:hypothetical protein